MWETWLSPWVTKIPWRRDRLPMPVFLPGEFHGQRGLTRYSPWHGVDTTERYTHTHTHTHTHTEYFEIIVNSQEIVTMVHRVLSIQHLTFSSGDILHNCGTRSTPCSVCLKAGFPFTSLPVFTHFFWHKFNSVVLKWADASFPSDVCRCIFSISVGSPLLLPAFSLFFFIPPPRAPI